MTKKRIPGESMREKGKLQVKVRERERERESKRGGKFPSEGERIKKKDENMKYVSEKGSCG